MQGSGGTQSIRKHLALVLTPGTVEARPYQPRPRLTKPAGDPEPSRARNPGDSFGRIGPRRTVRYRALATQHQAH